MPMAILEACAALFPQRIHAFLPLPRECTSISDADWCKYPYINQGCQGGHYPSSNNRQALAGQGDRRLSRPSHLFETVLT